MVRPEGNGIGLQAAMTHLAEQRKRKHTGPVELEPALDRLEKSLAKCGGKIYPQHGWNDNVEMFLVAILIVIGIRTFFLQPFIIPTNSMNPTYFGMTFETYAPGEPTPNPTIRALRFVTRGATFKSSEAPASGELMLPVDSTNRRRGLSFFSEEVAGRNFLILPARKAEYVFYVGTQQQRVRVPSDASSQFGEVVKETFFREDERSMEQILDDLSHRYGVREIRGRDYVQTGIELEKGEHLLAFDLRIGDALFVDRMSYHVAPPKVGDPFVFRTDSIPAILGESYYIKLLVGKGGDTLQVQEPLLLRNGEPITGARAFEFNHEQTPPFDGYFAVGHLRPGASVEIPDGYYWAMGDNSDNSSDSRLWARDTPSGRANPDPADGLVPEESVVGRAIFIYYPLTKRWGSAK